MIVNKINGCSRKERNAADPSPLLSSLIRLHRNKKDTERVPGPESREKLERRGNR